MSDSSDEGDQRKEEESTSRMWAESEPGPSRARPSRQGYCGYCRVLYNNLDQHLSSLRHLDSVRASSRGSSAAVSTPSSTRTKLTLLERFLQDVLKHHPHSYHSSPSQADLSPVSTPPMAREGVCPERLSAPIREQQEGCPAPEGHPQTPAPVHRKAHRKTNRRKTSESSSSSQTRVSSLNLADRGLRFPWLVWQKQRRKVQKEEAFSSDHSDSLDRTIEEVIQMCCHGDQQEEMDSFHFSLPVSMETQSDNWDAPVQVRGDSPVQVSQTEGRSLIGLLDAQVTLEDPGYSYRLDSALIGGGAKGGGATDSYLALPIDQVLPVPEHFPESFRGKSWLQIQQEDEMKVERLVQQFRRGRFLCYFESESLARYGRRRHNSKEAEPDSGVLPLLDGDDDEVSACFRKRRRRGFRVASRCQVVKVSRSTQTLRLVIPAVCEPASEAPPPDVPAANQEPPAERTPAARPWRSLPASYRGIVTPLQPRSQLLFLLCSPSGSAPPYSPLGSAHKRCRKKTRPLERPGSKVTYKRLPVSFYEPGSNRILSHAPRGSAPRGPAPRGSAPSRTPPPCVRQLFRSLSPDLNAASRVRGHRSPLSALSRDSDKRDKQEVARRRGGASRRGRRARGGGRDRTRPPQTPKRRRTGAQAAPNQPRREGLRSSRGRS
ncbi:hypothetical protein EPR50_G00235190 [Perca flavescens]|uniref:DBF4-type domain-containing protein n=1 Tax=Perca flavescens TaxID=8167 RepID=A0A484BY01_PERFV|nr:hypothetical protein EPR50_G00235190 [Perca flavescens]